MLPDRYEVIDDDALSGGYGIVVKVRDKYLDRVVLFKSMQNPENNAQLINEIKQLSKARSRHIIEIYDVIIDADGVLQGIIIEYLTGRDYTNYNIIQPQNMTEFIKILFQISKALLDLHSVGIIHRDIKLENFKASDSGLIKVFDFGLSVNDDNYFTKLNRGTIIYAAPELYVENATISPAMDIYALGICAWALLKNFRNFPQTLLQRPPLQQNRAPSINTASPMPLHPELANSIDDCLSLNPQSRPSAAQLVDVFSRHLNFARHKGLFVHGERSIYELSNTSKNVNISLANLGSLKVYYDGLNFIISEVTGDVYINNNRAAINNILHESCLITFGAPTVGSGRQYMTFSSSNPEVVL
ncbi:protein kinase family protein [Rahnella sp. PD12R]|uniref:protein kinase family protein n=1 Tax=Rahnella sp. PD12R TaxID=2855688 RepID=UPI001C47DCD6|nr:protein kinase family protein [Rahnella sp. PD12R]MBV6819946.1 protein kinase family protein [Rahnella sp. PD12R]